MHYVAPHGRGPGGFVILPIRPKPDPAHEPRTAGWLSSLFSSSKAAK